MSQTLPPYTALRAFEAAARHLSFSKAADELHVTTAAISHQIKGLEEHLGEALFHRRNRGLELTEVGRAGLSQLSEGFAQIVKGVKAMRNQMGHQDLAVAVTPSFASKWLVPRLPRFSVAHPAVDLRVVASLDVLDDTRPAAETFRSGETDLAIQFGKGNYPDCRVDKLLEVSAVPLCSPQLLSGKHPLRRPEDLRHHTLVHDDTPYDGHPAWVNWLNVHGVSGVDASRGPRFNHISLALQAAIDGQGVALGLEPLAAADVAAGRLVKPFELSLPLPFAYYVISPLASVERPEIKAFREWLLREADSPSRSQRLTAKPNGSSPPPGALTP